MFNTVLLLDIFMTPFLFLSAYIWDLGKVFFHHMQVLNGMTNKEHLDLNFVIKTFRPLPRGLHQFTNKEPSALDVWIFLYYMDKTITCLKNNLWKITLYYRL